MKCLVFCVDFRKKYVRALGSLDQIADYFDIIIDAVKICKPSKEKVSYSDYVVHEKVVKVESFEAFARIFESCTFSDTLVYNAKSYKIMKPLYEVIAKRSERWGIAANHRPIRFFSLRSYIRFFYRKNILGLTAQKNQRLEYAFVNLKKMYSISGIEHFKIRHRYKVRHFDAVACSGETPRRNICVFLDQYLPFHSEIRVKHGYEIPVDHYYSRLRSYLKEVREKYGFEDVVVARHPNSNGEELPYLEGFRTEIGNTAQLVCTARCAITHYSDSLSSALQIGVRAIHLDFPDLLPAQIRNYIRKDHLRLSTELHTFTEKLTIDQGNAVLHLLKRYLYRTYYNPEGECVMDCLMRMYPKGSQIG